MALSRALLKTKPSATQNRFSARSVSEIVKIARKRGFGPCKKVTQFNLSTSPRELSILFLISKIESYGKGRHYGFTINLASQVCCQARRYLCLLIIKQYITFYNVFVCDKLIRGLSVFPKPCFQAFKEKRRKINSRLVLSCRRFLPETTTRKNIVKYRYIIGKILIDAVIKTETVGNV